jgi:hypothetical protein
MRTFHFSAANLRVNTELLASLSAQNYNDLSVPHSQYSKRQKPASSILRMVQTACPLHLPAAATFQVLHVRMRCKKPKLDASGALEIGVSTFREPRPDADTKLLDGPG